MKFNDGNEVTLSHWDTKWHNPNKPIITVDFDHTITSRCPVCPGWNGKWGPPQEGAKEVLKILRLSAQIVIFSGGGNFDRNYSKKLRAYLNKYEIPFDKLIVKKPPAMFMIDDRAVHHTGWKDTLDKIQTRMFGELELLT